MTVDQNKKKFTGSKIGAIFCKITSRITTKKLKIGQRGNFEKIDFFSFFLMRKRLSSGQTWFARPYFPLNRGMFVFRSGLRFSFREWWKGHFHLLKWLKWVCFWQNCTKTMIRVGSDKKLSGWIMDLLLALKILCASQQGRTVPPWGRDGNSNFLSWINNKRRNRNTERDFLRGYWAVDTFMKKSSNSKYF